MNRRILLNLGLLALVALLAVIVYFEPGAVRDESSARLTGLSSTEVTRLEIRPAEGEAIVLVREAGQWQLESPIRVAANEFRVEAVLRMIDATSRSRFEAVDGELHRYGLDVPLVELRANGTGLAFGATEPIDRRRYVRVDDTIHLIDVEHFDILNAGYTNLVSSRLLPEGLRPARLELPDLTLIKDAQGRWETTPELDVSMDALNRLIDAWVHARAIMIQRYEPQMPVEVITIESANGGERLEFDVIETRGDLILGRPELGLRYHLGADQGRRMLDPTGQH